MYTSTPREWTVLSWRVRIISRPVRSPTWARRGYWWPPKFRCRMRPSGVRSKRAPQASSSLTRAGASWAWIGGGERGGHPALGHHRVRLPEERLADEADRAALGRRLDRGAQPGAPGAHHQHVVGVALVAVRHRSRRSPMTPAATRRT